MEHPSVRRALAALAALLVSISCAERPLAGPRAASARMRLALQAPAGTTTLALRVFYARTTGERVTLHESARRVDSLAMDLPLAVEIARCLRDPERDPPAEGCPLQVSVALRDAAGAVVDSASAGPVSASAGGGDVAVTLAFRPVARLAIDRGRADVLVGDSMALAALATDAAGATLRGRDVTWSSTDARVATVSAAGVVRGLAPGRATVTATRGELTASAAVLVPAVRAVVPAVRDTALVATARFRVALNVTPEPGFARTVAWASSAPAVATVDDSGSVTAVAPGTATITATATADTTRRAEVTVRVAPFRAVVRYSTGMVTGEQGPVVGNVTHFAADPSGEMLYVAWGSGVSTMPARSPVAWSRMAAPPFFLSGVAVPADGRPVIVGAGGRAARWTGTAWAAERSGSAADLNAVWADSGVVWAVGAGGTILRRVDTTWTATPSGTTVPLQRVWSRGGALAFAVGDGGTILRFDGAAWTPMASGVTDALTGVWAAGPGEAYAVGLDGRTGLGFVLRFDGARWERLPTPPNTPPLVTVSGSGPGDVWVSGGGCRSVMRWSGGQWATVGCPEGLTAQNGYLPTIWAGRGFALVGGYNATSFLAGQGAPRTLTALPSYRGAWASAGDDLFLVGEYGAVERVRGSADITRYDLGHTLSMLGVWGADARHVWAVAGSWFDGGRGQLWRFDGASWSRVATPTGQNLWGIWGSDTANVVAVGDAGTALRYDGRAWTAQATGANAPLHAVWGASPRELFAVGRGGTIVHYDGTAWRTMASGTTATLWSVWGSSPTDVYAVGDQGTMLRYDGARWTTLRSGQSYTYFAVWGSGPHDVYASSCGPGSGMDRFDGQAWRRDATLCGFTMTGFASGGMYIGAPFRTFHAGVGPRGTIGAAP